MDLEKLLSKEKLCINDEPSACTSYCPIHVDVKNMVNEISKGNFDKAYKILIKKMPFPKIISRICEHTCENVCVRSDLGGAVSISNLERAAILYGIGKPRRTFPIPRVGKKIAVVGGGISGLTAAVDLDKKGYDVTIYEKESKLGGRIWKFPKEVLPDNIIDEELEPIYKNKNIKLNLNTKLSKEEIESLVNEYDAVYVGIGKSIGYKVNENTFETGKKGIFSRGILSNNNSVIFAISAGRRAAISIDRYVNGKSLTAVRENEGSYTTRLHVNLEGVEKAPAIAPKESNYFSREESINEALRCIKCECTECKKACPHLRKFNIMPKEYIRQINQNELLVLGDHSANKMINSCNTCGLCGEVCPSNLNMKDIILDTRTSMVERGKMPPSAYDFALRDMEFSTSDKFALLKHQPGFDEVKYLFFPGCQLSGYSPYYVRKSYEYLMENTHDGVGVMLGCCGAPAEWAGEKELFKKNLDDLKQKWKDEEKPIFIFACATCCSTFEKYAPEIKFISLWEFMAEHGVPKNNKASNKKAFTVHDACTTRHNKKIQESVRKIIESEGYEIEELKYSKEKTKCCGYGGLAYFANREQVEDSIKERIEESDRDYIVYCSMCRELFAGYGKRTLHILDLIYGEDLDKLAEKEPLRLWERRANRHKLKNIILEMLGENYMELDENTNDIDIVLPEDVKNLMEDRLILLQDIKEVIRNAEETGEKFINPENNHYLARKKLKNVTYWVEYEEKDGKYLIYDVYSHRMEIVEE